MSLIVPEKRTDGVSPETLIELYRQMLRVYYVEERCKIYVKSNRCSFHASTRGHEKLQIACSMALKPGVDWFFPYYREKALMVGLGMPIEDIFRHMLSRETDPSSGGRNMSEHFSSRDLQVISPTACTGTQYLAAVGMAKAVKKRGAREVVYVSSGEGATSEGEFFEALNWAAREKLPVLFVIQNNGYAISVPQTTQTGSNVHDFAKGFFMESHDLDGTRFTDMYNALLPMVERIRGGEGPVLVDAKVVRLDSHSSSDNQLKYRTEAEIEEVRNRDPLAHTRLRLLQMEILSEDEIESLNAETKEEVDGAAAKVEEESSPDVKTSLDNIYSGFSPVSEEHAFQPVSETPITMVDAVNHGLHEEMEENDKIIMWGEDIADPKGGVFGVTRGLTEAFPERVSNSPLAEASIVGVAQGMSIGGYKPVVEIQFGDYIWPAFMQLRNEIPTLRWRSHGAWSCPLVVRVAVGGYIRGGPFHSQCIETQFAHTPGWLVAFPSNAADAKGLIKTACRLGDPVIFLEHKGLYRQVFSKSPEPPREHLIPFGKARVHREGDDITVVTWGTGVHRTTQAAAQLDKKGISVEIVDLRTIVPLDEETVYASVRKTSRALVVHEDVLFGGFGGEVASLIGRNCFEYLDSPVARVGAQNSFVGFAVELESAVLPSVDQIRDEIERTVTY